MPDTIDVISSTDAPPENAERVISIGKPIALLPAPENTEPARNKGGRPKGKTTRWDAPSMIAKRAKLAAEAAAKGESRPDTDIFGTASGLDEEPETTDEHGSSDFFSRQQEQTETPPPAPEVPPNPELHRPVASMIWDAIVMLLATFIGNFWLPRKVGDNAKAGEIPMDERKMVIDAFCEYFASLGMILLSPLQKLWLAIGAYSMPRLFLTVAVLKEKFFKKQPKPAQNTEVPGDTRFPPRQSKPAEQKKEEPEAQNPNVTLDAVHGEGE